MKRWQRKKPVCEETGIGRKTIPKERNEEMASYVSRRNTQLQSITPERQMRIKIKNSENGR